MAPETAASGSSNGPVVFAYDGSELAQFAVEEAGRQLAPGRDCLVVCVWQPTDVGFVPIGAAEIHTQDAVEVRQAAEEVAAHGASLAEQAGFRAQGLAVEAAPSWKGIVQAADEKDASLIVFGSHMRRGLMGHLAGSVAASTVAHTPRSVLIVHLPD